jgi:hypothetical protein
VASANLNELYLLVALNRRASAENWSNSNMLADRAKKAYEKDSLISLQYHRIANGKWNHMMDQTHIGYTYWQQPPVNRMPAVKYVSSDSTVEPSTLIHGLDPSAKNLIPKNSKGNIFYELDGIVSMEAANWTRSNHSQNVKWKIIPDIGRTGSGVSTFPVTRSTTLSESSPNLQYDFYTYDTGSVKVNLYFSPTLNFNNEEALPAGRQGLKFAVSIDDEKPQVVILNKEDNNMRTWESWVANNIIIKSSQHKLANNGKHVLKYWAISPAVVLQKLVIDLGGLKPSYLGPPETKF